MRKTLIYILFIISAACLSCKSGGPVMQALEDPETGQILISDNGKPVLQYNYKKVFEKDALDTLPANKYAVSANDTFMANPSIYAVPRSNYIHPVYGLYGEMLTRDWSKDHPHHRGIYWAWPEVDFGNKRGDLHALQKVFARPASGMPTGTEGQLISQRISLISPFRRLAKQCSEPKFILTGPWRGNTCQVLHPAILI